MRKRRMRAVLLATLSISILFSGCGNSSDNNTTSEVSDTSEKTNKKSDKKDKTTEEKTESTEETTITDQCGELTEETTTEEPTTEETTETPFSDSLDITTDDGTASTSFTAFDTFISITTYGTDAEAALKNTADLIDDMDSKLNSTHTNTEIYDLNQTGEATDCSEDLKNIVSEGIDYYEETDGALNFALYPLSIAWGFRNCGDFRIPSEDEIAELLPLAEPSEIDLSNGIKYKKDGMQLDLLYLSKGYTGDKISETLLSDYTDGLSGALITLGGNITMVGSKPDGKPWKVGIQDPNGESGTYVAVVSIDGEEGSSKSVCTDGIYVDSFEQDGKTYHHLIDPSTGYPAESGIVSASVIAEDNSMGDAFASALVVMGYDKAVDFWKTSSRDFDMILVDTTGTIYVTEGISANVSSSTNTIQIISEN